MASLKQIKWHAPSEETMMQADEFLRYPSESYVSHSIEKQLLVQMKVLNLFTLVGLLMTLERCEKIYNLMSG